jgi:hypothetical protein
MQQIPGSILEPGKRMSPRKSAAVGAAVSRHRANRILWALVQNRKFNPTLITLALVL